MWFFIGAAIAGGGDPTGAECRRSALVRDPISGAVSAQMEVGSLAAKPVLSRGGYWLHVVQVEVGPDGRTASLSFGHPGVLTTVVEAGTPVTFQTSNGTVQKSTTQRAEPVPTVAYGTYTLYELPLADLPADLTAVAFDVQGEQQAWTLAKKARKRLHHALTCVLPVGD